MKSSLIVWFALVIGVLEPGAEPPGRLSFIPDPATGRSVVVSSIGALMDEKECREWLLPEAFRELQRKRFRVVSADCVPFTDTEALLPLNRKK